MLRLIHQTVIILNIIIISRVGQINRLLITNRLPNLTEPILTATDNYRSVIGQLIIYYQLINMADMTDKDF
jgi:hypothetical protein